MDSSTRLRPVSTTPSTGTFSPGRTRSRSPGRTRSKGTSPFCFQVRGLGGQVHQRADGPAGPGAGTQLEHLPEQNQSGDGGGSLEIDRRGATMDTKGSRDHVREQRRREAVDIGRAGAQADQREHVQVPIHNRPPCSLKERRSSPEHDWRREQQLSPRGGVHPRHGDHHQGRGQHQADPEPALHVRQLGVLLLGGRGHLRFERHAALRAGPGTALADLRVHGAGVPGAGEWGRRFRLPGQVLPWLRTEPLQAPGVAEVVGSPLVFELPRSRGGIDVHVADGVLERAPRGRRRTPNLHESRRGTTAAGVRIQGLAVPFRPPPSGPAR